MILTEHLAQEDSWSECLEERNGGRYWDGSETDYLTH